MPTITMQQAVDRAIRTLHDVPALTASLVAEHSAPTLNVQPGEVLRQVAAERLAEMLGGLEAMPRRKKA